MYPDLVSDPDITIRRKVAFLLNSLLLSDGSTPGLILTTTTQDIARDAISKHGIPSALVAGLVDSPEVNEDFEEKAARALLSYLDAGGRLEREESLKLLGKLEKIKDDVYWGLAEEERERLARLASS